MTVAQYLALKEKVYNTTFIINSEGGFYLVNGELIPAEKFERENRLPITLVTMKGRPVTRASEFLDGRVSWIHE